MSFEDIVRLILCKSILVKSEFCINIFNLISNFFAEGQTRIIYLSPPGNLRYLSDITKVHYCFFHRNSRILGCRDLIGRLGLISDHSKLKIVVIKENEGDSCQPYFSRRLLIQNAT